jgi:hypothetical protein
MNARALAPDGALEFLLQLRQLVPLMWGDVVVTAADTIPPHAPQLFFVKLVVFNSAAIEIFQSDPTLTTPFSYHPSRYTFGTRRWLVNVLRLPHLRLGKSIKLDSHDHTYSHKIMSSIVCVNIALNHSVRTACSKFTNTRLNRDIFSLKCIVLQRPETPGVHRA